VLCYPQLVDARLRHDSLMCVNSFTRGVMDNPLFYGIAGTEPALFFAKMCFACSLILGDTQDDETVSQRLKTQGARSRGWRDAKNGGR
jgi:hypothetical protein